MYKIYSFLIVILFFACNPMDDIYKELDEGKGEYSEDITYTLTPSNYETVSRLALAAAQNANDSTLAREVATYSRFNSFVEPKDYMDNVLSSAYPALKDGSTAMVTYNVDKGDLATTTHLGTAIDYRLTNADYESAWGESGITYFTPNVPAESNIPSILSTNYPDAEKDDLVIVEYKYSILEPGGSEDRVLTSLNEDFESASVGNLDMNGWTNYIEEGSKQWAVKNYSGNNYLEFTSYNSNEENICWLITPKIDLTDTESSFLTFDAVVGHYTHQALEVFISDDYNGTTPETATWVNITKSFYLPPYTGGYSPWQNAGYFDLANYRKPIYVAFKYSGDGNNAKTTTYQIDNIVIDEMSLFENVILNEDFESYTEGDATQPAGWLNFIEKGSSTWKNTYYGLEDNNYSQMTSYRTNEENIAWLITAPLTIEGDGLQYFTFDVNVSYFNANCFSVLLSTDFDGTNVLTADWEDITSSFSIPQTTGNYLGFESAGSFNLTKFKGKNTYIAFKYHGDANNGKTTNYQIDNVRIFEYTSSLGRSLSSRAVLDSKSTNSIMYEYNGTSWIVKDSVFVVSPDDYKQMGEPGNYNNFSASILPDKYLPTFLTLKAPYAQEGDIYYVVYKYFANNLTVNAATQYIMTNGQWVAYNRSKEETEQYVHSQGKWAFDPTISFVMKGEDYGYVVDWVQKNKPEYMDSRGNTEYYFGFTSYYANVNVTLSTRRNNDPDGLLTGKNDEEAEEILVQQVIEGLKLLLQLKYPGQEPTVNGVEVFANVTYYNYDNGARDYMEVKFQCTAKDEWTYLEGPTVVDI